MVGDQRPLSRSAVAARGRESPDARVRGRGQRYVWPATGFGSVDYFFGFDYFFGLIIFLG